MAISSEFSILPWITRLRYRLPGIVASISDTALEKEVSS